MKTGPDNYGLATPAILFTAFKTECRGRCRRNWLPYARCGHCWKTGRAIFGLAAWTARWRAGTEITWRSFPRVMDWLRAAFGRWTKILMAHCGWGPSVD